MEIEDRANPSCRQFVLLRHAMLAGSDRPSHWDLMLDLGEKLLTFELRELPPDTLLAPQHEMQVTRLADHRREYLTYEGALSVGADAVDRGSVTQLACGWATCRPSPGNDRRRCHLIADSLSAEIEYRPCGVGEQTQLQIFHWQLRPDGVME